MDFKGKKILIMGLGLLGGGAACVKWFVKHGARVTVTDLKSKKQLQQTFTSLKNLSVTWVLGRHRESDFKNSDLVIQNPDVPRESKYLKMAAKAGVGVENEASIFLKNCRGQVIGVTGTRGKSTTSALIYNMLLPGSKAYLAGLPKMPMLDILDRIKPAEKVVLELSSWQLEVLGAHNLSPQVAVVTNIYNDHLNRYSGMKQYIAAKKNIFKYQKKNDITVLNFGNKETKAM